MTCMGDFDMFGRRSPSGQPSTGDWCPECHDAPLVRRDDGNLGPRLECEECGAFYHTNEERRGRGKRGRY